jgi:O-antigen/teichoic acid export membrane protein
LLWILTPGAVFLACGQVVGDLLRGRNHPTVVAWAQGLAAIFTVVLLIALLPIVGVYGAAIASTAAYGAALAVMLHSLRHLPRHARGSGWVPAITEAAASDASPVRGTSQPPASQRNHAQPGWR